MQRIVKFYSDNCAPCKAMAPIWWEFIEWLNTDISAEEININDPQGREEALALGFRSVPSFAIFYEDGTVLKHSGLAGVPMLTEKLVKV